MPILPPIPNQPFDTVNTVLTLAKTRLNDEVGTILPVTGRILQNNQDFSLTAVNGAWFKMQECLGNMGDTQFRDEVIIQDIPVVQSRDPAKMCWLSWFGFFDTQNYFTQPALPLNLSHPLKIWERWSNQNMPFCDPPMECMMDGIPNVQKWTGNRFWEWRANAIWMPGSQIVEDLRIRFATYFPDFADEGTTRWYMQPVPVMRCRDALAWLICAEICAGPGMPPEIQAKAVDFQAKGYAACDLIFNRDVAMKQRVNVRRQPRSGRAHQYWDNW